MMGKNLQSILSRLSVSSLLRKIETMQKQKDQVMQPVTMAVLIAVVILSELPSFSALINSSSHSVIPGKPVSPLVAETMGNTDELRPSNFVNFPVYGNVYPNGFYYVPIVIGNPPKHYYLNIDTGSDLTWLPKAHINPSYLSPFFFCSNPEYFLLILIIITINIIVAGLYESQSIRYIRCDEPLCIDVKCKNTLPCDYEISYLDGVTSRGHLVADTFALQLKGGSWFRPTLVIGRGAYYSSTGPNRHSTTHGMLGLGKGKISILSQLRRNHHFANIFGHCLSSNSRVSGFMFIGQDFDYSRCLTWVPMSSDVSRYSLTTTEVMYGDHEQSLLGRNQAFVLDSGTTNTYFVDPLYQELLTKVADMPLQKVPGDDEHPDCWEDTRPFTSIPDLRNRFSSLYLKLGNGRALEIPPENYLIITEDGVACLAIFNGFAHGLNNFNLIGAISMQNVIIVYDNEVKKIGWARVAGCSKPPVGSCTP
ncbi:hypothetical protein IEQ34_017580 [Dendrobium chrysotoxum]|uniref:Peptidase A1 domain-containing protein n=1 Tax=Dendrobium chrysotoxum TaxID=161865 RepID=A0AAV7G9X6_DENCH|nr:hypothetical protein IEQ34_017580 [Dendrobium chrysotoxum]